jgi:hypothetical protein
MKFHIDISAEGYAATFRNADDAICGTDTGPLAEVNAICGRVQADDNFVEATYTGTLNPVPPKFSA